MNAADFTGDEAVAFVEGVIVCVTALTLYPGTTPGTTSRWMRYAWWTCWITIFVCSGAVIMLTGPGQFLACAVQTAAILGACLANPRTPARPRGVRIAVDDTTYDVSDSLRYRGVDNDGTHVWTGYGPSGAPVRAGIYLTFDTLPPRTAVHIPTEVGPDGVHRFTGRPEGVKGSGIG